jgi:hypothetical protein
MFRIHHHLWPLLGLALLAPWAPASAHHDPSRFVAQGLNFDYDGDGKKDFAVYRPATGMWHIWLVGSGRSGDDQFVEQQWGVAGDIPMRGDYDGDGRSDFAVFRPSLSIWYVISSSTGFGWSLRFGEAGDVPVSGDFDGDKRTDLAVWRPSTGRWLYIRSSNNTTGQTGSCGVNASDKPVTAGGDLDGDGRSDFLLWRASTGNWCTSSGSGTTWIRNAAGRLRMGSNGDIPMVGDFQHQWLPTRDPNYHLAEPVISRPGEMTFYTAETRYRSSGCCGTWSIASWGLPDLVPSTDVNRVTPVPGDGDGDGFLDFYLYDTTSSPARWLIRNTTTPDGSGMITVHYIPGFIHWGSESYIPL